MASLIRPLNRCLMGLRQANNFGLVSVIQSQQRFKSKDVQDSLDKPFNKNKVSDPNADPKESCKNSLKIFFSFFTIKKILIKI